MVTILYIKNFLTNCRLLKENKGRTCCRKKTLGKTTYWLKAPRIVFVPCCRLGPVIRRSNEVKLASAKFRLGRESCFFLLYFRTHPISSEKRIATDERDYRLRRRVSIMWEVRCPDPFLGRRILSCYKRRKSNYFVFSLRCNFYTIFEAKTSYLPKKDALKSSKRHLRRKNSISVRIQLATRFSPW